MSPYLDARDAAAELLVSLPVLKRMAARREYPELTLVTRGRWIVRRSEHEAFLAGRTTSALVARAELMLERARAKLMGDA